MKYRYLYDKLRNTDKYDNEIDYYMSFFFKHYGYTDELVMNTIKHVNECQENNFPFSRINNNIFIAFNAYARNDYIVLQQALYIIYANKNYEYLRNRLDDFHYDYFIDRKMDYIRSGDRDLYRLLKTYDDCHEMIASYSDLFDDRVALNEFMSMLCSIYWIDGNTNYDEIYCIIKNHLNTPVKFSEKCLLNGIDINNFQERDARHLIILDKNSKIQKKVIK